MIGKALSKVLVVFGATGQQGGAVINYVLKDPVLSQQYKIRAVTRDLTSEKVKALKEKVEVVQGDLLNKESLSTALKGASTVFSITPLVFGPKAFENELTGGKNVADVAVAEGVDYIIISSLPSVTKISGGKYTKVAGFDAKAQVEEYVRTLPIRSAFFQPGSFMQNWHTVMKPRALPDGTFTMARHVSPKTQLPLIDINDTGKFVGAILAEPEKYEGKAFAAASGLYSLEEVAQIMSKTTGKTVTYTQISEADFKKNLPPWADMVVEMVSYQQDYGYYGSNTKELVAWAAENAREKPTSFEDYLAAHPLEL